MRESRSRVEWQELVKVLAESGSTAREFAAKHDLKLRTLEWWRSRFRREEGVAKSPVERNRLPQQRQVRAASKGVQFARVAVTPAPTPATAKVGDTPTVRLEVGRVRISVRNGFDRGTLAAVLQVLGVGEAR